MTIIRNENITKVVLDKLYNCSAMTWLGLNSTDFEVALNTCGADGASLYLISGAQMNRAYGLKGDGAYPEDLNIVAIDKYKGLAINYGARWFDDIVENNHRNYKGKSQKMILNPNPRNMAGITN